MNNSLKGPDRIDVTQRVHDLIGKIDALKFFRLDNPSGTTRSELFIFAMALGLDFMPKKLENTKGLVLAKSIDHNTNALMLAQSIYESKSDNLEELDKVISPSHYYHVAEEYANCGFSIIEEDMRKKTDSLMWEYLRMLEEKFEKLNLE